MSEKTYQRRLSERQAAACENATQPRCACRCGGKLHGAKRGGDQVPGRAWFEELPPDDPHRLTSAEELEERRKTAREIRQLRGRKRVLEHDAKRLEELGHARGVEELRRRAAELAKRIEWLRTRHAATPA